MKLEDINKQNSVLDLAQLRQDSELIKQIQTCLKQSGYLQDVVDGIYGSKTEAAIARFAQKYHLNNSQTGKYGSSFAKALLDAVNSPITSEQVSKILNCPLANAQKYLPGIVSALSKHGCLDKLTLIAIIATIGTEVPAFAPINEYGGTSYFTKLYEGRRDLGNTHSGDGARYHGRGFIQLTGRANYRSYGQRLGVDLEDKPDLALDAAVAAEVLVLYFCDRHISDAARRQDWRYVRKAVNGGYNGWDHFIALVGRARQVLAA